MAKQIPSIATPRAGRRLDGRHAIVFGAGTMNSPSIGWSLGETVDNPLGVGKATAVVYARNGASVSCVDLDFDAAEETASLIRSEGGTATAHACDATQSAQVETTVGEIHDAVGDIDILHNNIGIALMGGPVEHTEEDFDRVISVNLKSMYLTCKTVLPIMESQGAGSIINIGSFAAVRFTVPWIAYCTSKGAVNSLSMGIAAQYAPMGIRCNVIAPGLLSTPMVQAAHKDNHADLEAMMRSRDAAVPMGWQGEGWDVGEAAAFLASDDARFITGQIIAVDGGSTIMMPAKPWE